MFILYYDDVWNSYSVRKIPLEEITLEIRLNAETVWFSAKLHSLVHPLTEMASFRKNLQSR